MFVWTAVTRLAFGAQHRSSLHQQPTSNTRRTGLSPVRVRFSASHARRQAHQNESGTGMQCTRDAHAV
eukprot:5528184-Pleurochrysis_carterae.AAC.2